VNLFVLVKQVPGSANVKIDEQTGTMVRTEHDNVINPLDENALEEALRLKRTLPGARVRVISMGPPQTIRALREALALGADEATLLSDPAFAGSDTLATARTLARALTVQAGGHLDRDCLVLCGERATDGETGQVGPMLSGLLGLPIATFVRKVEVQEAFAVVERVVEDGFERLRVPLPAVVTVVKDINQPGFPTLDGKLTARTREIPVLSRADLGIDPGETGLSGSPTRVVKIFRPKLTRSGILRRQEGNGTAVDELLGWLDGRKLL
jgi:electron transfer flavoprotein beta subunit